MVETNLITDELAYMYTPIVCVSLSRPPKYAFNGVTVTMTEKGELLLLPIQGRGLLLMPTLLEW